MIRRQDQPYLVVVLAVVLPALTAGLGLRLQSMWGDEVFTLLACHRGLPECIHFHLGFRVLPLYPVLAWVFTLGGASILGGRLLSLLAFMGASYFLFNLASRLFNRKTAMWTALAFATNPLLVWYAQDARMYMVWLMLCLGSLLYEMRVLKDGRRCDSVVFGILFFFGLLTHLYFVFFGLASTVALLWVKPKTHWKRVIATKAAALLLAFPAFAAIFLLESPNALVGEFRGAELEALGYIALVFGVGFSFGPTSQELHSMPPMDAMRPHFAGAFLLIMAFWSAVAVGLAEVWRNNRPRCYMIAALMATAIALPLAASYFTRKVEFNARYVLPALPFALMAFGYGVQRIRPYAGALLVALLFTVQGYGLFAHYTETKYWKEDYEGVASFLKGRLAPQDEVYSAPYDSVWNLLLEGYATAVHLNEETLDSSRNSEQRRFYILNVPWITDPSGHIREELEQLPSVEVFEFRGFSVFMSPPRSGIGPTKIPAGPKIS